MKSRKLLVLLIIFCLQMLLIATRWPLDTNDSPKIITGTFGEYRPTHIHSGIDIRATEEDKVYVAESGIIEGIILTSEYSKYIIIQNDSGREIMYVHIQNPKEITYIDPDTGIPKIRQIKVGDIFTDEVTEVTHVQVLPGPNIDYLKIPWNTEMCEVGIYYSNKEKTIRADHLHFGVRNSSDEFENPLFFLNRPVDVEEPIIKYVGILSEDKSSNIKYHSQMPAVVEGASTLTATESGLKAAIIFMPTVTGNIDDDPWISVNGKIKFLINAYDQFGDEKKTAAPYDLKFYVNKDKEHRYNELYYWMQFNSSPRDGTDSPVSDWAWDKIYRATPPFVSLREKKNWFELYKDAGYINGIHQSNINDGVWDTLSGNYPDGFYELQFEVSDLQMPTSMLFPGYPTPGVLGHKKDGFIQVSVDNTVPIVHNITISQYGSEIYSDEDQFLNVDPTEPLDFSIQFNESMDNQDAKLTVTIKNSDDDVPDEEWILDISTAHTETKGWDETEFEDDTWHGTLPAYLVIPCEEYKVIISKDTKDLAGNQINPKRDDKPDRKDDGSWNYETGDDKKEEFTLKDVELPIATGCESNFVNRPPSGVITVEETYYLRNEGTQKLHIELFIEDLNNPINIGWSDDDNEEVSNVQYGEGDKIGKSISFEIDADGETKFSASVLVAGDEITASTIIRIREAGDACQKTVDQPVSLSYEKGVPEIVINSTPIILTPECTLKTPAKIEVTITVDVGSIESYECPIKSETSPKKPYGKEVVIEGTTILGLVIVEATSSDKKSAKARRVIKAIPKDCHEIHTIVTPDPTFVQQSKKILITDISPEKIKLLDYELDWSGLQPYEAENYLYEKYEEYYINNIGPSGLSFNDAAYSEQLPTIAKYSFSPVSSPGVYDIIELFSEFSDQGTADFHIYDSLGDEQKSIWDKEPIIPGINKAEWNGRDNYGYYVSDGEYTFVMKYSSETDEEICKEGRVIVDKTLPTIDTLEVKPIEDKPGFYGIYGNINDKYLKYYEISDITGGSYDFINMDYMSKDGLLGELDGKNYPPGEYVLRISAYDYAGNYISTETTVVLNGGTSAQYGSIAGVEWEAESRFRSVDNLAEYHDAGDYLSHSDQLITGEYIPIPDIPGYIVEDDFPASSTLTGSFSWITDPVFSGGSAHQNNTTSAWHSHYYLAPSDGVLIEQDGYGVEKYIVQYIYLKSLPHEIMMQFYTDNGNGEHRCYFGADLIPTGGVNNTPSLMRLGGIFTEIPVNQWVRLKIPTSAVGLVNKKVKGILFGHHGGDVVWDKTCLSTEINDSLPDIYPIPESDVPDNNTTFTFTYFKNNPLTDLVAEIELDGTVIRSLSVDLCDTYISTIIWDGKDDADAFVDNGFYTLNLKDASDSTLYDSKVVFVNNLDAEITVPAENSLIRASIPIAGIASARDFARYVISYGKGNNPTSWTEIVDSSQEHMISGLAMRDNVTTVFGNLGQWNVGGDLWWGEEVLDDGLNGEYTLKLEVWDRSGNSTSDEKIITVGRKMSSFNECMTISESKKASFSLPFAALDHSYLLMSIVEYAPEEVAVTPSDDYVCGNIFELRPPGEIFHDTGVFSITLPASTFDIAEEVIDDTEYYDYFEFEEGIIYEETPLNHAKICLFDTILREWHPVRSQDTVITGDPDTGDLNVTGYLRDLPPYSAYFTVMAPKERPDSPYLYEHKEDYNYHSTHIFGWAERKGTVALRVVSEDTDEEKHYTNQNIRKLGWFFFSNVELFPGGNHIYATLTDEFGWQSDESNPMYINVPDISNSINNIEIFEETFAQPIISISSGEKFYIEAINDQQNIAEIDTIEVRVSSETTDPDGIIVRLEETAVDSGDYRGSITVKDISQLIADSLKGRNTIYAGPHGEKITVALLSDPAVYSDIAYIDSSPPKIKDIYSTTHPSFAQYHFTGSNMGWYSRTPDDGDVILNISDEGSSDNFLRFVKGEEGSDYSYIISEAAVDCGEYPIWSFDYRTEQGVSFNLYLEIGSKLYFIPLTGDETGDEMMYSLKTFDNGQLIIDNYWHNYEFDIYSLLHKYVIENAGTAPADEILDNNYTIKKVYLGDWICDNFFIYKSQNQTGSYFDIDNFIMESADPLSIGDAADIKIFWTGDEDGLKYASVFSTIRGLEPDFSLMNANTSFEGYSDQLIGNELFYYLNLAAIDPAGNRSCVYPYRVRVDRQGPYAYDPAPVTDGGAIGTIHITDGNGFGVDPSTISVYLNSEAAARGIDDPGIEYDGLSGLLTVNLLKTKDFIVTNGEYVRISLTSASDRAGNLLQNPTIWEWRVDYSSSTGGSLKLLTVREGREPAVSPAGGKIAFVSLRGGNDDIWLIESNDIEELENTAVSLTGSMARESDPALLSSEGQPSWSPDGTRIAFTSDAAGIREVYTVRLAEPLEIIRLTNSTLDLSEPTWLSNDTIVFEKDGELWKQKLTGGVPEILHYESYGDLREPSVSNELDRIALRKSIYDDTIRIFNVDNKSLEKVTTGPLDFHPSWLPGDSGLLYSRKEGGFYRLWTSDLENMIKYRILENTSNTDDCRAASSPDGKNIYFQSSRSGEWNIWVLSMFDLENLYVEPAVFSPNDDGIKDITELYFTISIDGVWITVDILDAAGNTVFPSFENAKYQSGSYRLAWHGYNDADPAGIVPSGIYSFVITARSEETGEEIRKTVKVTVQKEAPTLSLALSGNYGVFVNNNTVFKINRSYAGNSLAQLQHIYYRTDPASEWIESGASQFKFDVPANSFNFQYKAIDDAGNYTSVYGEPLIGDNIAPVTLFTSESGKTYFDDSNLFFADGANFTLNATDTGCGVKYIRYSIGSSGDLTYDTPVVVTGRGNRLIRFYAGDNLINNETVQQQVILLDPDPPEALNITFSGYATEYFDGITKFFTGDDVICEMSSEDGASGVKIVEYKLDADVSWNEYTGAIGPFTLDSHVISYRATDNVGNVTRIFETAFEITDSIPYSAITIDPAPYIDALGRIFVKDALIGFTWDPPATGVMYRIHPTTDYTFFDGSSSPFTLPNPGMQKISFYSYDNLAAASLEDERTYTIYVDDLSPVTTVAFTGEHFNNYISGSTGVIFTSVDQGLDEASGVKEILYAKGTSDQYQPYTIPLLTGPSEESVTYHYYSEDNTANIESPIKSITLDIDRLPPIVELSGVSGNYLFDNASGKVYVSGLFELGFTSSDTGSGVRNIYYLYDLPEDGSAWNIFSANFADFTENTRIYYFADDNVGNSTGISERQIIADNQGPQLYLSSSMGIYEKDGYDYSSPDNSFYISGTDVSGIDKITYTIDGYPIGGSDYSDGMQIPSPAEDGFRIGYKGIDLLNNESQYERTISVDSDIPVSSISVSGASYDPGSGYLYITSSTVLSISATDMTSGIANTEWRINNMEWTDGNVPLIGSEETFLEYRSLDNVGNLETVKSTVIYVDDNSPVTSIAKYDDIHTDGVNYYVTPGTSVFLSVSDESLTAYTKYRIDIGDEIVYDESAGVLFDTEETYTFAFRSTDILGNVEVEKEVSVICDLQIPLVTLTCSKPLHITTDDVFSSLDNIFKLNWTDASIGFVEYQIDASGFTPYVEDAEFQLISAGAHTIEVKAWDATSTLIYQKTWPVYVDNTPPSGSIAFDPDYIIETVQYASSVTDITLTGTDTADVKNSGVKEIQYSINKGNYVVYTAGFHPYILSGIEEIDYTIVDNVGNEESYNETYSVDGIPPLTYISFTGIVAATPQGLRVTSGSNGFSFISSDPGTITTGVDLTQYRFDDAAWIDYVQDSVIDLASLSSGLHEIGYHSIDNLSNMEDERIFPLYIDNDAPAVTHSVIPYVYNDAGTGYNWISGTARISLSATDIFPDVIKYRMGAAGEFGDYCAPLSIAQEGDYLLSYYGIDKVGNTSATEDFSFNVDIGDPEINYAVVGDNYSPDDGPIYVKDSTTFDLSATDTGSGVKSTQYSTDGIFWVNSVQYPGGYSEAGTPLYFRGVDNVGNFSEIVSVNSILDESAPSLDFTINGFYINREGNYAETITGYSYTISAADTGSGIDNITYSINGGSSIITDSDEVEFILAATGLYTITYSAVDNLGNSTGDYEFTIKVTDEINCVLAISDKPLHETDTQLFASLDYVFTLENRCPGSAFDLIEYNNDSVEGTYLTYSIPLYPSAQATYSIFYKAVNTGDGTYGPVGELIVDIDDLPPDSTLATSGPSSGTYVNHETLFTISVSEHSSYSTSGVRNSYFKYGTDGYSIYDVPFTITSEDGPLTVSYYSEDNVFNTETENTEDFTMDNTPPEITLTATNSYGEDPLYVLSTTDITLEFTDAGCGEDLAQCYYKVDDGAYILYSTALQIIGQGSHILTVKSADLLGNETEEITYDIFLDGEVPVALISVVSGPAYLDASSDLYVSTETYFGISGTDSGSGLEKRYYSIDGGTDIEYTQDFNMTLLDGSHTISAYVSDNLGNISTTVDKTVILDSIPPTVPLLTTAVLTFDGVLVSFTGSTDDHSGLTDAHSGVNSYILSRNNKKIADIAFGAATYLDEVLPEGYDAEYTLCAVDNVLNISGESSLSLSVTDLSPVVTLTSDLTKFSPDGDECEDQVIFTLNVSDDRGIEYWTLDITSMITGQAIYSIAGAAETTNYIFTWDGNDASGLSAPEGTYTCTLTAEDPNGNQDIDSVSVDLDTTRKITTIALDNTIEFPTGYFTGQPIFNSSGEIVTYMLSEDECRCNNCFIQPGITLPYNISRNAGIWSGNIDGTLIVNNVPEAFKPAGWPWWQTWYPPPTDVPKLSFDDNYLAYFRGYKIEILDLINNTTDIIDESVLEWDHVWNKQANDLAFISRTNGGTTLKIYNESGISTVRELYAFSYGIDWSNNGQFLAVNGTPDSNEQGNPNPVYTVNLAGSVPVYQKISENDEWCWQPLISPDNRKLAYFSWVAGNIYSIKVVFLDEAGNLQDYNGAPAVEIADFDMTTSYAVDMIGWSSDSKYVYYALADNMIPGEDCLVVPKFSASPDPFGEQVNYTILPGKPDILEYSIGKVDFLGRNDTIIANNMEIAAMSFGYAIAYPAISRDGTKIVYSEYNSGNSGNISILGLTEHPECEQGQWNVPGSVANLECDVIATVDPSDLLSPVDTLMISSLPVNSIPGENTNLENIEPIISEVYDIKLLSGQTEFNNSIELTFTYTDEEVEGLDETRLQVWTYNDESGMWHIAQTDDIQILRDTAGNSLTVMVDSISGLFILSGYYGDETRPEFISSTVIPLYFSPNGDNCLDICELRFTMDKFARADLRVFDRGGNVLFEDHRYVLPNEENTFIWNGLSSDGMAYTDELYAFELTAVDVEGLESNVYYESVFIDLISPVSSVNFNGSIYQIAGTTFVSDMSNLEISSVDGGLYSSGVENVMFSIDESELQQYLMPVYFSGLAEGLHEMSYYGKDNACNTEISSSASFTVDGTPPEIALDYHPFKISGVNTLVFKGTLFSLITQDALSGVKNIQYRVASASGQNDTGWMNYVDQFVLPFSIPGKYTISYKASDNVDNTTEEFTIEVILVPATETIVAASEFERVLLLNGEGFEEPETLEFLSGLPDLLIVDNIVDFVDEMRTGMYNVYWINEKDENLPGSTSEELKEHVFSGKGLLSSGYIQMISEGGSPELFNLKYTGEYPENDYIVDISDSIISNAGTIPVEGWIQRLEVYDATVVSQEIPGTITISGNIPAPVISLNSFGDGKASYYGFDLLNNAGNISMEEIISRNIDYFAPASTGEYLPGMVAVVTINVIADISTDIRIIETVPQNVEILKAYDSGVIDENTITFDFASSESEFSARYLIRIPDYSGDLDFNTNTLYKVDNIWFNSETVQRNVTVASTVAGLKESIMEKLAEITAITQYSNKIGNAIKIFERIAEYPGTIDELDKAVSDILKSIGNVRQVIDVDTKECLLQMDKLLLYYESLYREVE